MKQTALLFGCFALGLGGCTSTGPVNIAEAQEKHPEARLYDASAGARTEVDAALAAARAQGKLVLLALGANWCHDSRAFAGWMEQLRFQALIEARYELVYVNVGMPQTGDGHNLDIARSYGIEIEGTPTVLVIDPTANRLLNADTAKSWRNAASRSEDAIYEELSGFTGA